MSRAFLQRLGVLSLWWWFVASAMAQSTVYVMYKDPKQPVAARVKDLLSRMSLEEKIGQMTQIDRTVATYDFMKAYSIGK